MMKPKIPITALGRAGKGIVVSSYAAVDAYIWVSDCVPIVRNTITDIEVRTEG